MDTVSRSGTMLTAEERNELKNGYRVTWIIWAALFLSLGIYILVVHLVGDDLRQDMQLGISMEALTAILLAVSAVELLCVKIIRGPMLQPDGGAESRSALAKLLNIPAVGQNDATGNRSLGKRTIQKYTSAMVMSLAISESIGIYGLILYIMGGSLGTMYIFMAFSAVAMYIYRPKIEEVEHLAIAIKQSRAGK